MEPGIKLIGQPVYFFDELPKSWELKNIPNETQPFTYFINVKRYTFYVTPLSTKKEGRVVAAILVKCLITTPHGPESQNLSEAELKDLIDEYKKTEVVKPFSSEVRSAFCSFMSDESGRLPLDNAHSNRAEQGTSAPEPELQPVDTKKLEEIEKCLKDYEVIGDLGVERKHKSPSSSWKDVVLIQQEGKLWLNEDEAITVCKKELDDLKLTEELRVPIKVLVIPDGEVLTIGSYKKEKLITVTLVLSRSSIAVTTAKIRGNEAATRALKNSFKFEQLLTLFDNIFSSPVSCCWESKVVKSELPGDKSSTATLRKNYSYDLTVLGDFKWNKGTKAYQNPQNPDCILILGKVIAGLS